MEKTGTFVDIDSTTAGSVYSARIVTIDIANSVQDYIYSDYKCLTLDYVVSCCNLLTVGIAFLSKTNITGAAFASCITNSKFLRTLKNKCKVIYLAVNNNFHFIL